jgi:DNA polymerase III subunit gamma/tau
MASTTTPSVTSHQALYRRWRAQTFGQIVGQDAVVETLRNAVRLDRLSHGLLLVGPRGTGKTSMARILAKAVNCLAPVDGEPCDQCEPCTAIREGRALDVVELDAASNNRVDDMRELLPRVYTATADLRRKVFIIDEVQRIKEGWDVLLKTLEEPPDDVLFIFCTTDPSQIRPAVVSRLQRFTFRPLSEKQISGKLLRIVEAENRRVSEGAIALIAQRAAGGMRDAESMLDQVLASGAQDVDVAAVQDLLGLAEMETVDRFIDALAQARPLEGVRLLDDLERDGRDLVAFADQIVARLRERLLAGLAGGSATTADAALLARAGRRLSGLDVNRGGAGGYRLQLELALLEAEEQAPSTGRPAQPSPASAPTSGPVARTAPTAPKAPTAPAARSTGVAVGEPAPAGPPLPAGPAGATQPSPTAEPKADQPVAAGQPEAAAPAPSSGATDSDELFVRLQAAWPEVVAHVARNPANRPLISACRPVEVRDGLVVLGFPENQAFLRDIAERKRAALEEGLAAVLGRSVGVRCVATNVAMPDAQPDDGAGDELVAQARRVFEEDLVDVVEVE